jgi:energy-coupling factor transport system ATP-binding protein
MVCHDMEVVADFAERVIVMSDGRVIDEGPTFDVLRRRRVLEEASLVPPQIMDLSLALSLMDPDLKATPIASANTLNEMQMAIEATAEHAPADGIITVSVAETSSGAPGAQELESVLTTAAEGAER